MKPLLIIPPAPDRWPAIERIGLSENSLWLGDLRKRVVDGLPGTQDALAVIPDGGNVLACAWLSKRHDLGVLCRVFTRPDHRGRGHAKRLVETLVDWFQMTGGKWLYATAPGEIAERLLGPAGFRVLRRPENTPDALVVTLRKAEDVPEDPLVTADGVVVVHDLTRANWPTMAVLLYNRPGADPRLPLDESAVAAETTSLELIARMEAETCALKGAFRGPRLVASITVATEALGERTYAMAMPHDDVPESLRQAAIDFARTRGYRSVDFPMEALAGEALPETRTTDVGPDAPEGSDPVREDDTSAPGPHSET